MLSATKNFIILIVTHHIRGEKIMSSWGPHLHHSQVSCDKSCETFYCTNITWEVNMLQVTLLVFYHYIFLYTCALSILKLEKIGGLLMGGEPDPILVGHKYHVLIILLTRDLRPVWSPHIPSWTSSKMYLASSSSTHLR